MARLEGKRSYAGWWVTLIIIILIIIAFLLLEFFGFISVIPGFPTYSPM